jgi:PPOX class probable F420-dependent enzyme
MTTPSILTERQRAFVAATRTAVLATTAPDGRPRLVPVCFVLAEGIVISPLDEKPKRVDDPRDLARVRDVLARPAVELLVHRWDEDWSRLGWVRLRGTARVLEPGEPEHDAAIVPLRSKYPQYASQAIDRRPMLRIEVERATAWGDPGEEPEP